MTELFRIEVHGRIDDREPFTWTSSGTVIDVEGTAFVRLAGNVLVPADSSWSPTAAVAKHRAAEELDAIAARISAKAAALRAETTTTTTTT
jgi:hypothetical protein